MYTFATLNNALFGEMNGKVNYFRQIDSIVFNHITKDNRLNIKLFY